MGMHMPMVPLPMPPHAKPTPVPTPIPVMPKPVVVEQTTVYVGKIPPTVEDEFIRKLLEVCNGILCVVILFSFVFLHSFFILHMFCVVLEISMSATLPPKHW
jgi:hypothetical protein